MRAAGAASGRWVCVLLLLFGGGTTRALAGEVPRVVVCFEQRDVDAEGRPSGDMDVHAQCLEAGGSKAWGDDVRGTAVARSRLLEQRPAICSDGAGGAIVVATRRAAATGAPPRIELVAERMAPEGQRKWIRDDRSLVVATVTGSSGYPAVLRDGEGGALVALLWSAPEGEQGVVMQRVLPDGTLAWLAGPGGVLVSATQGMERPPVLVPDGAGGAIVLFEYENEDGRGSVMAQRVSAGGRVLWNEGKPVVVVGSPHTESQVTGVSDGEGGAIVVLQLAFTSGKHEGDVDIVAQRLSATGERLWREGKSPVTVASTAKRETDPVAVSDGAGGVVVAFVTRTTAGGEAGDANIWAQRLDGSGRMVWHEGQRATAVSTSAHDERAPAAVANPDGGMTVVFELAIAGEDGASEEVDIYAQRLSAHGRLLWNEGRRSSPACAVVYPERHPVAVSDGRGGTVVLATMNAPDTAKLSGAVLLVAQHLDARGRRTWKGGKGVLPVAASSKPPLRPAAVLLSTARAE